MLLGGFYKVDNDKQLVRTLVHNYQFPLCSQRGVFVVSQIMHTICTEDRKPGQQPKQTTIHSNMAQKPPQNV